MIFHELQPKESITASAGAAELKLRIAALIVWLVATMGLVAVAVYAQAQGWSSTAADILKIATAVVGSGGLGIILGEKSGAETSRTQEHSTTKARSA